MILKEIRKRGNEDETKTETKANENDSHASVAKWYGNRLLTGISRVRISSGASRLCSVIGHAPAS